MRIVSRVLVSALITLCTVAGPSHAVLAQADPCAAASGTAYGLCTAYCIHMKCESPAPASQEACLRIAANYAKLTGGPLSCAPASGPQLACTCAQGFLICSASGLEAGVPAFLNIDLTAYFYGFNGVADAVTDSQGNVQFAPFDLADYLADRNLVLQSVGMALTNMPGITLAQTTVATCPAR